jgi:REP element-mobilizing transposase RayT
MREPIAYFLTWRAYGTWLPGDERGWVDAVHNVYRSEIPAHNAARLRRSRTRMRGGRVEFDGRARNLISSTIQDHGRLRKWEIYALAVQTNHVHVVVQASPIGPERMMSELKAWCSRRLRASGCFPSDARVWARHGSTRYLWDDESLNAATAYVLEGQDVPR